MEDIEKLMNYLVGQVMKATKGKADPALVRQYLYEILEKTYEDQQQKKELEAKPSAGV